MSITRVARAFEVSTTNREITAHAGAVLIRETARAVGLGPAIEGYLKLKQRDRGLSEAEFVLSIAEAVAMGATCLDDLALARSDAVQEELRGFPVPAPQTAGIFLRRFSLGHIRQLDKALREVHRNALSFDLSTEVTLDFDSSYVKSYSSRRQGADPTWLKRYALHPLFCFLAEHGTCLHAKLRRGRAMTSRGINSFVDETLRRIPKGVKIRARFDSGFYSADLFEHLEQRGVTYVCGAPLNHRILASIREIGEGSWSSCLDKDEGEVAEFWLEPSRGGKRRRYVVKRIEKNRGDQLDLETGLHHYWVLVTNDHRRKAGTLESEHRHKAQVESWVRELKENFGLHVFRKHEFMANWAWLLLVTTAHNLIRWTQLLGKPEEEGDIKAKRFRYRYLNVPALLVRSGRRLILKLRHDYPLFERFRAALMSLRSLPLPAT